MRQRLKHPDQLMEPDPRNTRSGQSLDGWPRPLSVQLLHGAISQLELSPDVPEDICGRFETVRNLFLYAWYVYDFTMPAILYGQTIVESAIREKCKRENIKISDRIGLSGLLKIAIHHGWLKNSTFSRTQEMFVPSLDLERGMTYTPKYKPEDQDYCEVIAETIPSNRNHLAHGHTALESPGMAFGTLELCAEIINALFSWRAQRPEEIGNGVATA